MTHQTLTQPFLDFLSKLKLRVIGTNQFIYPSRWKGSNKKYCKIEQVNTGTLRVFITFAYSRNLLVLLIQKHGAAHRLTVEKYEMRPHLNYSADLYIDDELVLEKIGREGTNNVGVTITFPRKPKKPVAHVAKFSVSVVIVTRNRRDILEKTLTSLAAQVKPGDEVLVVDDGSTDGTDALIKSQFPKVRYLRMEHKGYRLATMKNNGILKAKNNFIICLDDDCDPTPGFLAAYKEKAVKGKLLLGGIEFLNQNGTVKRARKEIPLLKGRLEGGYGGNICFDKFDALRVSLFDEDYNGFWGYEDTDFLVKMKESGIKLSPVFSATVQHQWHPVDQKLVEEGKQRNCKLLRKKVEAYKKGVFQKPKTVLILVDQYDWAWDITSKELLKHLPKYRETIVSLEDFLNKNINPSEFDLVLVWYWIMRRFEDKKMVGDPRVLDRLNCPEKTILCVAGEHVLKEGFDIKVAQKFKYIGANNKKIYGILKRLAPEKEITLLSHGVDLEKFKPKPSGTFTVGWVGSTTRQSKRYKLAKEAVETMPNVTLKLAGHVSHKKLFIHPDKMPAFYHSLDCLLVTSETESHPLVVYEAMASGVPVITTPVGNIREFIKQRENGLLIPRNCNVDHIRDAINTLRNDPALARRLSVNARETVEQRLNWPLITRQYTEFFDWVFLPQIHDCKFTVSMLVSRDDELLERAVASVVKQGPDEFRAYIDKFTLKDTNKAEKILKAGGAKIFYQTFDPKNTSYQLHTCDVARNVHRAILEAENKWVCWIDDDDEMLGDRRLILGKYGASDVGLIHGDLIRVFPRPTEGMIKAKIKDLTQPIVTVAMDEPRDAKRCVGSGTIYNRYALQENYKHIQVYMEKKIISASFWDYMIAYWIKRKGWKTVHVPTSLSIQNVNLDHPPERKKLYGQWNKIADDLDNLTEEDFEIQN